jgi:regulator of sigma E protease
MDVSESVGGPITIATMFGDKWDWLQFWNLTASLSIILAFMNLLPIPGLDGGHVLFLAWELITGKKASDKVVEYATTIGFFLLIGLMVAIFWIDISRLF